MYLGSLNSYSCSAFIIMKYHAVCNTVPSLQWRHNEHDGVSNHRRLECLLNPLFRRRSKKILKLRVAGLCEGNPPVTGGFLSQRPSNSENVSIWWLHHATVSSDSSASRFGWMIPNLFRISRYDQADVISPYWSSSLTLLYKISPYFMCYTAHSWLTVV